MGMGINWKKDGDCIKVKDNKWDGEHDCSHDHYYVCNIDGYDCATNPPPIVGNHVVFGGETVYPCDASKTCVNLPGTYQCQGQCFEKYGYATIGI